MNPSDKIRALVAWKRPIAWTAVVLAAPFVALWVGWTELRRGYVWGNRFPNEARALRAVLRRK